MAKFLFVNLLQDTGWKQDVEIVTDEHGFITHYTENCTFSNGERISGFTLPGFQNAHSHAFQFAMAGLAEIHQEQSNPDDFWSWRDAMYKLALSVEPDELEAIATQLYCQMVKHGYTNVAEFHYLHHDKHGNSYKNPGEMGERMVAAAKNAGINITLIPICYQKGGFGKDATPAQRRFISPDASSYFNLLSSSQEACKHYRGASLGIGIHSLRAVEPSLLKTIVAEGPSSLPFHLHIAEQLKEVDEAQIHLGERPVAWLLDNVAVNERFHLVHATHLSTEETRDLARSKANVVLCPSTEGNLGDGLFPLMDFQQHHGKWSIGTDSHVGLNPLEELRLLDYGQRLISHKRSTFSQSGGDSGKFALAMSLKSGRLAMGNMQTNYFEVGASLDALIVSSDTPLLANCSLSNVLSTIVYTADASQFTGTIARGKWVVKSGVHFAEEAIKTKFTTAMKSIGNRM